MCQVKVQEGGEEKEEKGQERKKRSDHGCGGKGVHKNLFGDSSEAACRLKRDQKQKRGGEDERQVRRERIARHAIAVDSPKRRLGARPAAAAAREARKQELERVEKERGGRREGGSCVVRQTEN
jgi:hypothetical protein